jgi:hypothetical protein
MVVLFEKSWVTVLFAVLCTHVGSGCAPTPRAGGAEQISVGVPGESSTKSALPATGEATLKFRLKDDFPDFIFPLNVTQGGTVLTIPNSGKATFGVNGHDTEAQRIEIDGWRPIWAVLSAGETASLYAHPGWGVGFEGREYSNVEARCARAKAGGACGPDATANKDDCICPGGSVPVSQALAADDLCGPGARCVTPAEVRFVKVSEDAAHVVEDSTGQTFAVAAMGGGGVYTPGAANPANMLTIRVPPATPDTTPGMGAGFESIALDVNWRYTVWMTSEGIARVTRDARIVAEPKP